VSTMSRWQKPSAAIGGSAFARSASTGCAANRGPEPALSRRSELRLATAVSAPIRPNIINIWPVRGFGPVPIPKLRRATCPTDT
jgi:hypothetical protein